MIDKADGRSLRSGFLERAAAHPDAPALVIGERTYTYGELERDARRWAGALVGALDGLPERVGVFAYRSHASYAGVLAALFSGAAFVPLNRTFPARRTRAMVEEAALDAIIVDEKSAEQLEEVLEGVADVPLLVTPTLEAPTPLGRADASFMDAGDVSSVAPLESLPPVLPGDLAYLLFTSGSTGRPKGVPVTHANICYFTGVMAERYDIEPEDRFSQAFDQTFDLSLFDLFVAWERGASVHVLGPMDLMVPGRFITEHELTVWFSVPSVPALMRKKGFLDEPGRFPSLRWSLFCGEPLPAATAQAWQAAAPQSIVENLYGPTELTLACLLHRWDPEHSPELCENEIVPIGRPYPGLGALVLDEDLDPVPEGQAGELCVCGPQVVPGYWKNAAKTAERFVSLSDAPHERRRFYRTGDRVRKLESGDYVHLGRTDHQIQVRGHRVELGEVEAALRRQEPVVQAVALGWPVEEGTAQDIVAFVTGTDLADASPDDTFGETLEAELPGYMRPREVIALSEMPLNANGKIDRGALRQRLNDRPAER